MNRPAFERLRAILLDVIPERLDMRSWICGSAACAAGHAMEDVWFVRQGFRSHFGVPRYRHYDEWDAIHVFFDVDLRTMNYVFNANRYPQTSLHVTPADVIQRIHEVLNGTFH